MVKITSKENKLRCLLELVHCTILTVCAGKFRSVHLYVFLPSDESDSVLTSHGGWQANKMCFIWMNGLHESCYLHILQNSCNFTSLMFQLCCKDFFFFSLLVFGMLFYLITEASEHSPIDFSLLTSQNNLDL